MSTKNNQYQTIIGAEIHVELRTQSKMFCGCRNDPFFAEKPNIYTCPVCLGLPGALPVPNDKAIDYTIMIGLALNCKINDVSAFDRKHYFYPDLPKGYQISQQAKPLCYDGYLETSYGKVRINRVHLEEDTAKLQHTVVDGKKVSLVDFNRSGVPLVEIVTEPDIHSPEQAKEFLRKLRTIVRFLGVSDADMEKGSMRLEANVSLSKDGSLPNYKVEVKNINSFRFYAEAVKFEQKRQAELLDRGETPKQETRGWDEKTWSTVSQRSKESAQEYGYFPEPDIPELDITQERLERIKQSMPWLPQDYHQFFLDKGVSSTTAENLSQDFERAQYTKRALEKVNQPKLADKLAKMVLNKKVDLTKTKAEELSLLIKKQEASKISDPKQLEPLIKQVIEANPKVVADYQAGKENAIGFLVGQVMKLTRGKADPAIVNQLLRNLLA